MFGVGDPVIVVGGAYGITKPGSWGLVKRIDSELHKCEVLFHHLSTMRVGRSDIYWIDINHLELHSTGNPFNNIVGGI